MFQRLLVAFPVGVSHHDFYFLCFIARFCREKEISILVSLATTFLHILSLCDSFALQEEIIIRIHAFILLHFAFQLPVFVVFHFPAVIPIPYLDTEFVFMAGYCTHGIVTELIVTVMS